MLSLGWLDKTTDKLLAMWRTESVSSAIQKIVLKFQRIELLEKNQRLAGHIENNISDFSEKRKTSCRDLLRKIENVREFQKNHLTFREQNKKYLGAHISF